MPVFLQQLYNMVSNVKMVHVLKVKIMEIPLFVTNCLIPLLHVHTSPITIHVSPRIPAPFFLTRTLMTL